MMCDDAGFSTTGTMIIHDAQTIPVLVAGLWPRNAANIASANCGEQRLHVLRVKLAGRSGRFSSNFPAWPTGYFVSQGPDHIRECRSSGVVVGKARGGGTSGRQFPVTGCETFKHHSRFLGLCFSGQGAHFCGTFHQLLCGKSGRPAECVSDHWI
jgi:hypothetical protein